MQGSDIRVLPESASQRAQLVQSHQRPTYSLVPIGYVNLFSVITPRSQPAYLPIRCDSDTSNYHAIGFQTDLSKSDLMLLLPLTLTAAVMVQGSTVQDIYLELSRFKLAV